MDSVLSRCLSSREHLSLSIRSLCRNRQSRTVKTESSQCRYASTNAAKPIRLEKPTKFVPPSHGKRLKQQIPRHYGPELTQTQKTAQAIKKYPNMMPPPGTFRHWFITSRGIHTFITLGTLFCLASFTTYENWKRDTPFKAQLPAADQFLSHPLASCSQLIEIFKMDVARTSAETAERRKKDVEDVQKRSTYRRAHGLESDDSQGLGGWTARSDEEVASPSLRVDGPITRKPAITIPDETSGISTVVPSDDNKDSMYVDWEGKKKPMKKWLGIW